MSYIQEAIRHAREVHKRLRNPPKKIIPITAHEPEAVVVPVIETPKPPEPFPYAKELAEINERLRRLNEHAAKEYPEPGRIVLIRDILAVTAKHYGVSVEDIKSARRQWSVVRPRQVAMFVAKCLTRRSLPDIGRHFGGRDHTTVLHGVRKIERLRAEDPQLNAEIETIINIVRGL